jgi:hypothetical protein
MAACAHLAWQLWENIFEKGRAMFVFVFEKDEGRASEQVACLCIPRPLYLYKMSFLISRAFSAGA